MKRLFWWGALGAGCAGAEPVSSKTVDLVQDLSMLAVARPLEPEEAERHARAIDDGLVSLDAYVDILLEDPEIGRVARTVIMGGGELVKANHPIPRHSQLSYFLDGDTRIYYLNNKCLPSLAVDILPWWNRKQTIKVCADSVRAEVKDDGQGRTCGASTLAPGLDSPCGCGPRLMFCTKDEDHHDTLQRSVTREITDTIAYVVNEDLPLEQLFLMNATVRDRDAERIYRRSRVLAGEPELLLQADGFSEAPALHPREEQVPGQHAGILTTPGLLYGSDALRGVLRNYYEYLWCVEASSSGVTTQKVLGLDVVNLREGDGWQQLAAMEVCTDCHARLDYGMQFFQGYPSSTRGIDFRAWEVKEGSGPLYVAHIGDPRGSDALTPQGFARLALTQPEFGECMAQKVSDHVLGAKATADDQDAVLLTFEDTHSYRSMLRTALLRFAEHSRVDADSAPQMVASAAVRDTGPPVELREDGAIVLRPSTRAALDNHCNHCHDGIDQLDLTGAEMPRSLVNLVLEQVAFGAMPKGPSELDPSARFALVDDLITHLWSDPAARAEARTFFVDGQRAYPAHAYYTALDAVATQAGAEKAMKVRALSSAVPEADQHLSPELFAASALVALDACKQQDLVGDALEACIHRATAPSVLVLGAAGPDAP